MAVSKSNTKTATKNLVEVKFNSYVKHGENKQSFKNYSPGDVELLNEDVANALINKGVCERTD